MTTPDNAGAQASVPEVVADDKTAVAAVETPKVETTEETAEVETTETPVEGAEVVETEEEKKTKSKLRREKQKAKIEAVEAENQRLREHLASVERNKPAQTDEVEPDPAKFDSDAKYIAALAVYEARKSNRADQARAYQTNSVAARAEAELAAQQLFRERAMALKDDHPDLEEKVFGDKTGLFDARLASLIMDSDKGPDVAYYLTSHREDAARIKSMSDIAAAREIGRIEAKLSLPKPRTETKAPPPPSTVSGTVKGPARSPENMSQAEYVKWRSNGGGEKRTG